MSLRSKVECATYCHAERDCNTAVYQYDGDCYLIRNFTDTLSITIEDNSSTDSEDDIIEMMSRHPDGSGLGLVSKQADKRHQIVIIVSI